MDCNDTEENIQIKTSHGVKYVNKKDVIHFSEGLPGFEDYYDFVIFDIKNCEPFKSMLSVKDGGPDFIVVDPFQIFQDYLPQNILLFMKDLNIKTSLELKVLSIVTLAEKSEDITVNLRGPIFLNPASHMAKQVILPDDRYSTRVPLVNS